MSDFGTMIRRIKDELVRPDLTAQIKLAIKDAVEFYESERFYFNEGRRTIDTADGKEWYGLPTNFQEVDFLKFYPSTNINYQIYPKTYEYIEDLMTNSAVTGRPYYYCIYEQQLRLYPIPNGAYRLVMSGLFKFDELTATSTATASGQATNAFMKDGKSLIRHHAKAEVLSSVIRGPEALMEAAKEEQKEQTELSRLRSETTSRRSTGKLTATKF